MLNEYDSVFSRYSSFSSLLLACYLRGKVRSITKEKYSLLLWRPLYIVVRIYVFALSHLAFSKS